MTKQSSTTLSSRSLAAAFLGAATLSVVGGLASSPLTQAAPPMPLSPACSQWQYSGNMPISQGNGQRADIPWQGTRVGGAIANVFQGNQKFDVGGDPEGGVNGNNIDFTVNWTRGLGHYTASINNDGAVVLGVTTDSQNHRADWHTDVKFTCAVTAAPPPAAPPPAAPAPVPAAPPAAAPVTNAIQLSFGPPHLGSITATVTNSSALTAKCTYDSTPFNTHRDFTVNPNGSKDLTFNGVNTNTNYHVVVSCHDASGKQTQEIGHQETNVAF